MLFCRCVVLMLLVVSLLTLIGVFFPTLRLLSPPPREVGESEPIWRDTEKEGGESKGRKKRRERVTEREKK